MAYTNAISSYRETRVKTASQGQLIIMLYEEAVRSLDRAIDLLGMDAGGKKNPSNIEKVSKSILKVQEIITELTASLDFEQGGEISRNLFSLYNWFNRELLEGNIHQDSRRIMAVRNQMDDLKGAWSEIVAKSGRESSGKAAAGVNIAG
ncbi:MAG: flagellar export chaperone FliS [Treponema sp.]|nr:flagellar export chaperone FliS [Treponema sp.]